MHKMRKPKSSKSSNNIGAFLAPPVVSLEKHESCEVADAEETKIHGVKSSHFGVTHEGGSIMPQLEKKGISEPKITINPFDFLFDEADVEDSQETGCFGKLPEPTFGNEDDEPEEMPQPVAFVNQMSNFSFKDGTLEES